MILFSVSHLKTSIDYSKQREPSTAVVTVEMSLQIYHTVRNMSYDI